MMRTIVNRNFRSRRSPRRRRPRPGRGRFIPFTNVARTSKGPSHRDMTVQTRKFLNYNQLAIANVEGDFAYGICNFNVSPTKNNYIGQVLEAYSKLYEQYRVRRVTIRAQCGKGYNNDRRVKTILVSRVDVDNQDTANTFKSFRALANATNSKTNTLTERGNVLLAEYRPSMFDINYSSSDVNPVLPNALQWNRLAARNQHQWRGAVLGVAIPEPNILPNEVKITLTQEVLIDFRGRINDADLSTVSEIPTLNPPIYDETTDLDELRNNLLTGVWFPVNFPHSIGNIGTSVLGPDLIGNTFRDQATMIIYRIESSEPDGTINCNVLP